MKKIISLKTKLKKIREQKKLIKADATIEISVKEKTIEKLAENKKFSIKLIENKNVEVSIERAKGVVEKQSVQNKKAKVLNSKRNNGVD